MGDVGARGIKSDRSEQTRRCTKTPRVANEMGRWNEGLVQTRLSGKATVDRKKGAMGEVEVGDGCRDNEKRAK